MLFVFIFKLLSSIILFVRFIAAIYCCYKSNAARLDRYTLGSASHRVGTYVRIYILIFIIITGINIIIILLLLCYTGL